MKNLDYLIQVHFQYISLFVPHSCPRKNDISHKKEVVKMSTKTLSLIYLLFETELEVNSWL